VLTDFVAGVLPGGREDLAVRVDKPLVVGRIPLRQRADVGADALPELNVRHKQIAEQLQRHISDHV